MKLKKVSHSKLNFIKFELMKLKILQKYSDKFTLKSKIAQLAVLLKKALMVISIYHYERNKILFIGIPQKTQNHYKHKLKRTKHIFLPESYSTTDLLTNKFITLKNLKEKLRPHAFNETRIKLAKNRFLLKKQFDLIVVVNSTSLFPLIKKEALKLKIPIVVLTIEEPGMTEVNSYLIPGELSDLDKLKTIFLSTLLKPIFKKCRPLPLPPKNRPRPYMKFKSYRGLRNSNSIKKVKVY